MYTAELLSETALPQRRLNELARENGAMEFLAYNLQCYAERFNCRGLFLNEPMPDVHLPHTAGIVANFRAFHETLRLADIATGQETPRALENIRKIKTAMRAMDNVVSGRGDDLNLHLPAQEQAILREFMEQQIEKQFCGNFQRRNRISVPFDVTLYPAYFERKIEYWHRKNRGPISQCQDQYDVLVLERGKHASWMRSGKIEIAAACAAAVVCAAAALAFGWVALALGGAALVGSGAMVGVMAAKNNKFKAVDRKRSVALAMNYILLLNGADPANNLLELCQDNLEYHGKQSEDRKLGLGRMLSVIERYETVARPAPVSCGTAQLAEKMQGRERA